MDGYTIERKLGKGAQGDVYLVVNKANKKQYVMKQIECKDESEANKAFKEAMSLKDLQHPYICGYREFFVEWDKKLKTIMVCIVMDHYACGDLQELMNVERQKKKPFDEVIVKKWLGQIIDVLKFIHSKGVIHRDLKPSNIFLKDKSLDLIVGDFGVATVMGDIRTKTRTAVGSYKWMAPEVVERPYDERSDVWSVGCIFLEILTCQLFSEQDINDKLNVMKNNQSVLHELCQKISKLYSKDLIDVVRLMLRRTFEQRPTAEELAKLPFVSECLILTRPSTVARAKRQVVTTKDKPVPVGKGFSEVLGYLKQEKNNEYCVIAALEWISKQENLKLDNPSKMLVAEVMSEHAIAQDVCIHGTKIFSRLSEKARENDAMFKNEVQKSILGAARSHPACTEIQLNFMTFAIHLSNYQEAPVQLGKLGAVQCILESMQTFMKSEDFCAEACQALWSLCTEDSNAKIAVSEGGLATLCFCIRHHTASPTVLHHATSAIFTLIVDEESFDIASEEKLMHLLLSGMKEYSGHTDLVKYSLMTISSLVEQDYMAITFIECQGDGVKSAIEGIQLLKEIYLVHEDNLEIVRLITEVIDMVLQHEDVASSVKVADVQSFVSKCRGKYPKDKKVQESCTSALRNLQT